MAGSSVLAIKGWDADTHAAPPDSVFDAATVQGISSGPRREVGKLRERQAATDVARPGMGLIYPFGWQQLATAMKSSIRSHLGCQGLERK